MNGQRKKVIALFVVLVIGGGLVGLGARTGGREKADTPASESEASFLRDLEISDSSGASLGSRELFFKMMFSVALVAVLAVAAFYLSKKVLPRVTNAPGKEIRIVETAYLGPRKTLHLVQVGNQKLLVGSTNETIATLAHLDEAWFDLSKQEVNSAVNL
ncbi:MAG: flagellar biosynthetic protein FliO [Sedimentisphaerales bacterium]|nr:flagellar biosynthetic protein FliO [Sedimentisphaerales bacterium]